MSRHGRARASYSTNVRPGSVHLHALNLLWRAAWRIAPAPTTRAIHHFYFTPESPLPKSGRAGVLDGAVPFTLQIHDKTVRGWHWGTGPAVLLAHGWNGRALHLSAFIKPLVDSGLSVLAFDAPAHGVSDGRTTSYFEITDTVRKLLREHAGTPLAGVIGHSLGASALINALHKENKNVPAVLVAPALRLKELIYATFDRTGLPAKVYRPMLTQLEQTSGYSLKRDNPGRLLSLIYSPTLIIHDTTDPVTPYRDALRLTSKYPHLRLRTTTGWGHRRILKQSAIVNLAIDFILGNQACPDLTGSYAVKPFLKKNEPGSPNDQALQQPAQDGFFLRT